jgi:hypothetical protein
MNILYYDLENFDVDDIREISNYLNGKGLNVVCIPKDFDLLLDVDSYTLHMIKQKIEDAIRKKEIINNM